MRILALDLGDVWVGTALSDPLKITASPYETVKRGDLDSFLKKIFTEQMIEIVVVGYPKTMGQGTESEQTKKIVAMKEQLEQTFSKVRWVLWDERLSSKRADQLRKGYSKEDKIKSHSIAAAFILQGYLDHLAF